MRIRIFFIVFAAAFVMANAISREVPLQDVGRTLLVSTSSVPLTLVNVRAAIINGGQTLGWQILGDDPNRLTLKYNKQGKHEVVVAVIYDASGFELKYIDSTSMNFSDKNGTQMIHPNYNRWVQNLTKGISSSLIRQ